MSIQSDIEMLSIQAMEIYAQRNKLKPHEVNELFHKHQIFEKIILQHDNDVVIGPVADDNTMETVQLYIAGILTADEAMSRLKYSKVNNQVSFHTEKALKYLKFIGRKVYE